MALGMKEQWIKYETTHLKPEEKSRKGDGQIPIFKGKDVHIGER